MSPIESLEKRLLLSVSVTAAALETPLFEAGNKWTYAYTVNGSTGTVVRTVIGYMTLSNGQQEWEIDDTTPGVSDYVIKNYYGLDSAGDYVLYGNTTIAASDSSSDVYSPPLIYLPSQVNQSTPYSNSTTDTVTDIISGKTSTSTQNKTGVVTLASETQSSRNVPAGTYSVYQITDVNDDGGTEVDYVSTQYGLIESDVTGGISSTFKLVSFLGAHDQLVFLPPPSDTGEGAVISPAPAVEILDANGNLETSANETVTISITPTSTGGGTLKGTLTQTAVGGIASFSDLSINLPGQYSLTATAGGVSQPSGLFEITPGKLVFTVPPMNGTEDTPIKPTVKVTLEDGQNNPITSDNTDIVTLNIVGNSSGNKISGNTAQLVAGVATFPDLTIPIEGHYKLQATDTANDTDTVSDRFAIAGDFLAFQPQPKSADVNQPIPLVVVIKNKQKQIDTSVTSSIALSLVSVQGGSNAVLSGTTTLAFVNGVAAFTSSMAPTINASGTYRITATEEDDSTGVLAPSFTTTAITSNLITISGLRLVVVKQPPGTADAGKPFGLIVKLVDKKGHLDTAENIAQASLSLQTLSGGDGAQLQGTTTATFTGGIATFPAATGPKITGIGTFKLLVDEIGSEDLAAEIATNKIVTSGYHLSIDNKSVPHFSEILATGVDLMPDFIIVNLYDQHDLLVKDISAPEVSEQLVTISGSGQLVAGAYGTTAKADDNSVGTYLLDGGVSSAGDYSIVFTAQDTPGSAIPAAAIEPLNTKAFHVYDPILAVAQTRSADSGSTKFPFAYQNFTPPIVGLADPKGNEAQVLPTPSVGLLVTLSSDTAAGVLTGTIAYSMSASLTASNQGQSPVSQLQISEAGAYMLTFTEVVTPGGLPFDPSNYEPVANRAPLSVPLTVRPDKIAFVSEVPRTLTVGQTFSVSLGLVDEKGNALGDFDNSIDSRFRQLVVFLSASAAVAGGSTALQAPGNPVAFEGGLATFNYLSFNEPGLYILRAQEALGTDGQPDFGIPTATDPKTFTKVIHVTAG